MNIAVIKDGVCVNVCVFQDLKTAQSFLKANVWPGASEVLEAPDGYGIGDSYADGAWTKAPSERPEPVEPVEPTPTLSERLTAAEKQNKLLSAQIKAQSERTEFLEDCIAEMATLVYNA